MLLLSDPLPYTLVNHQPDSEDLFYNAVRMNVQNPPCTGCQSRTQIWAALTVGGPRNTWWCNDCYLLGRPRAAANRIWLPNLSHHGSSSPWNISSNASRGQNIPQTTYMEYTSMDQSSASNTPLQHPSVPVRICQVCHKHIPHLELSRFCLSHQYEPLCLACTCPICRDELRKELKMKEEIRSRQSNAPQQQDTQIQTQRAKI